MFALFLGASPAFAHGNGESDNAGTLVRQAIAHIVHDPNQTTAAADKINDAKNAADKEGVDMDLVAQAGDALARGDPHQARTLLELSIGARPHLGSSDPQPIPKASPRATGAQTGIDVVTDPLASPRDVTGADWATLSGLLVLGVFGVYLAVRFRPHNRKAV